jgi:hypothetical protein
MMAADIRTRLAVVSADRPDHDTITVWTPW